MTCDACVDVEYLKAIIHCNASSLSSRLASQNLVCVSSSESTKLVVSMSLLRTEDAASKFVCKGVLVTCGLRDCPTLVEAP